jgi:hypothetical protein
MATIRKSKAKVKKAERITSSTIREHAKKDHSPKWDNCDMWDANQFLRHFHDSMKYYNLELSAKDYKPAVVKWMLANNFEKEAIDIFKQTKDWRCSTTMGSIALCLLQGMTPYREDFNGGRNTITWLTSAIDNVVLAGQVDIEEDDTATAKLTGPVISIQERVREATFKMTEELEDAIESWMVDPDTFEPKKFKVLNLLKGKEAKPAHARVIKEYYATGLAELTEVVSGTADEDLTEGYSTRSKKQLNSLILFYKEIDSACLMLMEEAKNTRKPRAKKSVPLDKLVEKLKFLKTFEPLKLVSINPVDIVNSNELWIYNTKTRKIGRYVADVINGPITVKGTSIIGFDEHNSIQKTIRKPEEKLAEFKKAGKVQLRKFLEDINATDTKMNGRLNDDTILLKVSN